MNSRFTHSKFNQIWCNYLRIYEFSCRTVQHWQMFLHEGDQCTASLKLCLLRQLAEPIPSSFISPSKWALRVGQLSWTNSNYKSNHWWIAQPRADIYSRVQSGTLIKLLQANRLIRGLELEASMVAQKGRGGSWGSISGDKQEKSKRGCDGERESEKERWVEKAIMARMKESDKKGRSSIQGRNKGVKGW